MLKWEYCVVYAIADRPFGMKTYYPRVYYMTSQGWEEYRIKERGVQEEDAVARFFATLGDEGWELVGCGNVGPDMHCVYFKRPKQ